MQNRPSVEHYAPADQKIEQVESLVQLYPEVAGLQAYEYLRSTAANQREDFVNNPSYVLDLTCPSLDNDAVARIKSPMLTVLESLMAGPQTMKTEVLYRAIEYRYSELFILDAARAINDPDYDEAQKAEAVEWFRLANENVYAKPQKHVFSALAGKLVTPHLKVQPDDSEQVKELRTDLGSLVGEIDETTHRLFIPSSDVVDRVGALARERFDDLVDHIDPDETYDADGIQHMLDIALDKVGGKELGWKTVIVPNSSALAVSAHQKQIEVGESREHIDGATLRGKTLHEVGTHAQRSMNAERGGWLSAQFGQDGYLDFEESLATALADAYRGKFAPKGENYYIVAGLAYGLDNHELRDFHETYEVMWRTTALRQVKEGTLAEEHITKAKSSAFRNCVRLFRGTTGQHKGLVYLKDLSYFNGQERAWSELAKIETQQDFNKLLAGKLDNTEPTHQVIAENIIQELAEA